MLYFCVFAIFVYLWAVFLLLFAQKEAYWEFYMMAERNYLKFALRYYFGFENMVDDEMGIDDPIL